MSSHERVLKIVRQLRDGNLSRIQRKIRIDELVAIIEEYEAAAAARRLGLSID